MDLHLKMPKSFLLTQLPFRPTFMQYCHIVEKQGKMNTGVALIHLSVFYYYGPV